MSLCAIEHKTAVVASYRSVSRNPVRFKALVQRRQRKQRKQEDLVQKELFDVSMTRL